MKYLHQCITSVKVITQKQKTAVTIMQIYHKQTVNLKV